MLCVVGRQLETASISDFVTIDNVCGLIVLMLGGSYPSAASTHWGQVVVFFVVVVGFFLLLFFFLFFFFVWGGGYGGDGTSSYLVHKAQACLSATFGQRE